MTMKELEIVEKMIDHWVELDQAIKDKNLTHAYTIKCWIGHDIENLYNPNSSKTGQIFDSKMK